MKVNFFRFIMLSFLIILNFLDDVIRVFGIKKLSIRDWIIFRSIKMGILEELNLIL